MNQPHILGSCKTSTFNQIYISFSHHSELKTEMMAQKKDKTTFNKNMKNNSVYMDDTAKIDYQSCVNQVQCTLSWSYLLLEV